MNEIWSSLTDKLLTALGALILMIVPPIRKFLYKWPLESAVVISTALSLSFMYLTVVRFSEWPGDPKTFADGKPDATYGDGWGNTYPQAFTSTCPVGSYAVGIKWYGLKNGTNCDRCASKIMVVCKPLATLPKLTIKDQ